MGVLEVHSSPKGLLWKKIIFFSKLKQCLKGKENKKGRAKKKKPKNVP